jgi:hypothetical protein
MGTELVRVEQGQMSQRALITKEQLKVDTEQRQLLMEYVTKHMVEGIDADYGVIPGTKKKTLLKPGAEKLIDLFRCTPQYKLVKEIEDFEKNLFIYMFRVRIVSRDAGVVLAEGYGSANSREGRYRWRSAARKCPQCGKEAIIQGKAEYGGGWLCFKKKDGCGAKFGEGDRSIEDQAQGQVENEDIATSANSILKVAKKRALVDGAIALARCSDLFTQDVEDLMPMAPEPAPAAAPKAEPKKEAPELNPLTHVAWGKELKAAQISSLTNEQLTFLVEEGSGLIKTAKPGAKWIKRMQDCINAMGQEIDRRVDKEEEAQAAADSFSVPLPAEGDAELPF